jgi:O-antigen ligase
VLEEGVVAEGSAQGRQQTAAVAAKMIPRHPLFGVGIGNFNLERAVIDPTGTLGPPHNSYLWALSQGGIITFGLYLMTFVWVYRNLRELERNYEARFREVDLGWLVRAMRTAMVGFLFFSLFADMWHHILFFVFISLCLAVINVHRAYAETGRLYGASVPTGMPTQRLAG